MFAKLTYKFEGFVDVLNGTFIEGITDLLESGTAPGDFREDRVDKIQTPKALVVSTTVPPDIMQQLVVLQAKVASFEAGQSGFSVCGGGRGGGIRVGHGRGRGTPQDTSGG